VVTFASSIKADLKLPLIVANEDSGPLVKALFESAPGKNLIAYREWMSLAELVGLFAEVTGFSAQYVTLPAGEPDIPLPEGLKVELDDNWAYFNECGYEARDDPTVIHPNEVREAVRTRVTRNILISTTVGENSEATDCSCLDSKTRLEFYRLVTRDVEA
jgi:hypothetical protein